MAITLNDNISASAAKPLDALRGPYTGADEATAKAAACAAIAGGATGLRFVGRQVDLIINGVAAVYVWKSDIGDADLIPMTTPLPQGLTTADSPTFAGLSITGLNGLVIEKSNPTSDAAIIGKQINIPGNHAIDIAEWDVTNSDGNNHQIIFQSYSLPSGATDLQEVYHFPGTGGTLVTTNDIAAAQQLAFNDQAGTTYTLALADANTKIRMSNAAANIVTIPTNASVAFPIGTRIYVSMNGTGATSIVGAGGVTIEGSTTIIDVPFNEVTLIKEGTDIWRILASATSYSPLIKSMADIPEVRLITSGDSAYARLQRTTISSNNLFEGKNQVQQVGGIGKALKFLGYNQTVSGDDTGLPSGSAITMTYVTAFRVGAGTNPFYTPITYGSGSNKFIAYLGDHVLRLYCGSIADAPLNYPSGVLLANLYYGDSYHDENWHQMIFTINGQACNFYIDNTLLLTVTMTETYNIVLGGANSLLSFWRGDEVPYNVDLDQTLVYNRELNRTSGPGGTDEVAALWNGGGFTATPPVLGLVRRWEYEEGTGNITYDINPGTKYPLTLVNGPSWLPVGIVPVSAVASEAVFFAITDGLTNAERGIATWGDFNGRNQQQGKWFQWFQGSNYPLVSNNTGQWLFNPANSSNTCPAILSTIEVAGNLAVGSGYAGTNAAPVNGLIVEGATGLGTVSPSSGYILDINGNTRSEGVFNHYGPVPEARWVTSADSAYASLYRTTVASDNSFVITNQVLQVGGVGKCLDFDAAAFQYVDIPTNNLPSVETDFTLSLWFKTTSNTNNGGIQVGVADTANSLMQIGFGLSGDDVYVSGWSNGSYSFSQPGLNDNSWHHIVTTVSTDTGGNSTVVSYLDGNLKFTEIAYATRLKPNNNFFRVGFTQNIITGASHYFTGSIDSVLGWTRALTSTEISALYNSGHGTANPPSGQLFRYEFEEGIGTYTNDTNDTVTPVSGTLTNGPTWDNLGIVPVAGSSGRGQVLKSSDGMINGERGIIQVGDVGGRFQPIGRWFQFYQNNVYPLASNNTGQWLFSPSNSSASLPTVASVIDIDGNVTIGSSYASTSAAPANGLLVQGNTLLGTATDNGDDQLQINGNLNLTTVGNKLKIAAGTNASIGTATLTAGTVTVNTTAITSASIIILTNAGPGGTVGILSVGTKIDGVSFVVNSSSGSDTSIVNWWIIN